MFGNRLLPCVAVLVLACSALSAHALDSTTTDTNAKPNILFLIVDDLNTWLLQNPDRYAGKVVAPNITRLAESGVNFTNNFTASPVCSPSRTAFLSGVAPWKSGVYNNGVDVSASTALQNVPSLQKTLQDNGYFVANFGKVYHGYSLGMKEDEKASHKRDPAPPQAPLNGLRSKGKGLTETDWGATHLDEKDMNDTKMADAAIAQLQKKHDKPFFIACGLFHPHMPWYVPQKYLDMYPLDKIQEPPILANDLDDLPSIAKKIISGTYQAALAANQYKQALQGYLASTSYADAQMGRVLDALENSPYKDNTIIVFLSDHGFHVGEKHHWQKSTLWEEATNSLLMFRVPGVTKPQQICKRPVSLLDIYPTLMDLLHITKPTHLDGHSLVPLLKNVEAERQGPAITAYSSHIAIRTDKYRLIRYTDGTTEFYDRTVDPHEWTNKTDDAAYAAIKKELLAYLPAQQDMAQAMKDKDKGGRDKDDN